MRPNETLRHAFRHNTFPTVKLLPAWLEPPLIVAASASGLRVEGGSVRVRVSARGYGVLTCGDTRVLVRGNADVTFTVPATGPTLTVALQSLRGTARTTVVVPGGVVLASIPAFEVAAPSPLLIGAALRPALVQRNLGPTVRPPWPRGAQPSFRDLAPRVDRTRFHFVPNTESSQ